MTELSTFTRRFREVIAQEPQQDVARRLGYTQSRVSQVARGEKPSRELVERLVEAYSLPREEWLTLAGYGPRPTMDDERETIASRAVELALERMGLTPEARHMADELKHAREQLSEAERILAEIVEVQRLHQQRNPGAPPLDVDFFRNPDLPFAEKIRLFTVLRERISRGELD